MTTINQIIQGDCVEAMRVSCDGAFDMAFADPPFNIGYAYDTYKDKKDSKSYLNWSHKWISETHRVLKPNGTLWLAIGDEYAAELKIISQDVGFHCRSWVIWHYTFGVNCQKKFARSHTHLFHFVKDEKNFTFNKDAILVPSARQTKYNDKRAAAKGKLPDDVWEYSRVCGTFKEREKSCSCQMPEDLVSRCVLVSSNPGHMILDNFSGSGTLSAVAKKLGRNSFAFDISEAYVRAGYYRLNKIVDG